jgi:hypothetical protein
MSVSIQSDFKPDQNIETALEAGRLAAQHGIDLSKLPTIVDMSAESITENVHAINSNCELEFMSKISITYVHDHSHTTEGPDERTKFLFKSLVRRSSFS